jgi:S-formylglutathione hydrolase FrmB
MRIARSTPALRRHAGALALIAATTVAPAHATTAPTPGWPQCTPRATAPRTGLREVRRTRDGRVLHLTLRSTAMGGEQPVDVLLPAGYDASGSTRYPVLYLLHGAGGDHTTWLDRGDAARTLADVPAIVVMPDGSQNGTNGGYADWYGLPQGTAGTPPAWETYHVNELVPFVDARFPTRADAGGRAIAGLSMGGTGAAKYAAEFPGTFGYAGTFSGGVAALLAPGRTADCKFGDPALQPVRWRDNDATSLAGNLRGVRVLVRSGTGEHGPLDPAAPPADPLGAAAWNQRRATEAGAYAMSRTFADALADAGVAADVRFFPGVHDWAYWRRDLEEFAAWWTRQLRHPVTRRTAFDVASAHRAFTAWGWSFAAHRRADEFDYVHVDGRRLRITGSGTLDVRTPPVLRPRARYAVHGGGQTRTVRADARGRLAFTVDLGPSHTTGQTAFPPRGWRTTAVRIVQER